MTKTFSIRTYAPLLVTAIIILMPLVALGQNVNPTAAPINVNQNPTASPILPNTNPTAAPSTCPSGKPGYLCNPLKVTNFCDLIKIVLQAILYIGMPIAVLFLVIVGFKFILAQGKPEAIAEAQKNFLNTVIGIGIFLGAWAIAKIIAATLAGLGVSAVNECTR